MVKINTLVISAITVISNALLRILKSFFGTGGGLLRCSSLQNSESVFTTSGLWLLNWKKQLWNMYFLGFLTFGSTSNNKSSKTSLSNVEFWITNSGGSISRERWRKVRRSLLQRQVLNIRIPGFRTFKLQTFLDFWARKYFKTLFWLSKFGFWLLKAFHQKSLAG